MPKFSIELSPEDEEEGWLSSDWYTGTSGGVEAWRVQFNRKVEAGDLTDFDTRTWNEELGTYDMVQTIAFLQEQDPDIEVVRWRHMPLPIYVHPLNLSPKIFEIEEAMSLKEAIEVAKRTWFSQFGQLGFAAAIWRARLAQPKDFKKMQELREVEEEVSDEGSDIQGSEPADEASGGTGPGERQVSELWLPKQG